MPIVKIGGSLAEDIKMGWKPKMIMNGAPIPLNYEYNQFDYMEENQNLLLIYLGPRISNSSKVHQLYANQQLFDGS